MQRAKVQAARAATLVVARTTLQRTLIPTRITMTAAVSTLYSVVPMLRRVTTTLTPRKMMVHACSSMSAACVAVTALLTVLATATAMVLMQATTATATA